MGFGSWRQLELEKLLTLRIPEIIGLRRGICNKWPHWLNGGSIKEERRKAWAVSRRMFVCVSRLPEVQGDESVLSRHIYSPSGTLHLVCASATK